MLRNLGICALAGLALAGVARADVFRWLDEHGEPHYSDRWVPGSQLIRSSRPHPTSPDAAESHPPAAQAAPGPAEAGSAGAQKPDPDSLKAVRADTAKRREQQCKDARDRYEKAMNARRIFKPGARTEEERQFLSDDEADAYRAQALQDVKELCGAAPAAG